MKLLILLVLVGCSGEAFQYENSTVRTRSAVPIDNGTGGSVSLPLSGSGGEETNIPSRGGEGGQEMAGSSDVESSWRCRFENSVCQCYVDPSVFESGWLDLTSCPSDQRCTLRDDSACVCWNTDSAYQNALTVAGTHAVSVCPVR